CRSASTKIAQPEPSRRSALLRRAEVATSSAFVTLSRSGPRKRIVRWNEPSLLSTVPGATSAAHGSQSARRAGRFRYSARFIMGSPSCIEQNSVLEVPAEDRHEIRVVARTPYRKRMSYEPQQHARHPQLKAQSDCRGQR